MKDVSEGDRPMRYARQPGRSLTAPREPTTAGRIARQKDPNALPRAIATTTASSGPTRMTIAMSR